MVLIGSVRLLSNFRNCFPFLVKPFISAPADTNILSGTAPGAPPNGRMRKREEEEEKSSCVNKPRYLFLTKPEIRDGLARESLEYNLNTEEAVCGTSTYTTTGPHRPYSLPLTLQNRSVLHLGPQ